MKNIYSFLLFISITFLLHNSCNKRKEGENFPDAVTLTTVVYDKETGHKISGATLGLYSNFEAYSAALSNGNSAGADFYITSNGAGIGVFDKVNSNTDYWLLATYKDASSSLFYSNENLSSKLDQFVKSSEVNFNVEVEPLGANVSFYTLNGLSDLPITVVFNGISNKITDTVGSTSFPAFYSKVATFSVKEGSYTYKASSANGCEWTGIIDVKNGQHVKRQLELCQRGSVLFVISGTAANVGTINPGRFPLSIYIDGNPVPVGYIKSTPPTGTTCTTTTGTLYAEVFLDVSTTSPGTQHTYLVTSSTVTAVTSCTWTGAIPGPIVAGCNTEVVLTGDCK